MYHSQLWKWKIKNHQFRIIFFFVIPKYLSLLFYVLSNIESIHSSGIICMRGEIFQAQHFPHIFVPISKGEWYGEFRHCNDRNNAVIDHLKIQKYTPPLCEIHSLYLNYIIIICICFFYRTCSIMCTFCKSATFLNSCNAEKHTQHRLLHLVASV